MSSVTVFTDGGARGNPGPAGIGGVIVRGGVGGGKAGSGETLEEFSSYIGRATNNQAEYQALLAGLDRARKHTDEDVVCVLDSELLVKQLTGEYRIKSPELKKLAHQVKHLEESFKSVSYRHTYREGNERADALVNEALDKAAQA
ncbi:MAG: ribonuclease HI family protein [bacterium]|nr:ribonuclease HI family protein [bacterium]MDZ4248263.1 ribonuclease HI family protein [Patescibacteria group bacterium]